ncbi:MAG TPA: dihydrodipicolinate synthase family protein [Terriglobales bacterium]|nr:dihydrodipicolinate synthase family protein [Terriglobales bacterium]
MKLTGIIPALATPLTDEERVDEQGFRRLIQYCLDAGVDGLLVNGSMGCFPVLTDSEQLRAVSVVVAEVAGAVPVLASLGETGTRRALLKAEQFARAGADFLNVLPPFYMRPNRHQVFRHYSEIASAGILPVLVYDNPVHTKCYIQPETVAQLCESHSNIVGVKESNADCENLQELIHLTRKFSNFSVLTGSETLMLAGLQLGCDGAVGGLYNICPHMAVKLYEAFRSGDLTQASQLQRTMIEIAEVFRYGAVWGGFDEAMRYLVICNRCSGAPYFSSLTEEEALQVRRILDKHLRLHVTARVASSPTD